MKTYVLARYITLKENLQRSGFSNKMSSSNFHAKKDPQTSSPKILLEKIEKRKNRKSEEKERTRRKKANDCTLSFYVDFSILVVTLFKNPALIYIFPTLAANRNLIKKRIYFKS